MFLKKIQLDRRKWTEWMRKDKYHGKPWLPSPPVLEECLSFDLSLNKNELLHLFKADVQKFLESNQSKDSYFTDLPRPVDKGKFMGMEIREKSIRLSCIEINGNNLDEKARRYELSQQVDLNKTNQFLEEVLTHVGSFMKEQGLETHPSHTQKIPLGITLTQLQGTGKPSDQLAQSELFRKLKENIVNKEKLNIDLKAVVSESTATLMTGHWLNDKITSGLVLGGGPEISYIEKSPDEFEKERVRVRSYRLDTFGEKGEIDYLRTQHDVTLDLESSSPGFNRLSKLLKGEEVAELTRIVLIKFVQDGYLFQGQLTAPLMTPGALTPNHLATIEKDTWGRQDNCMKVLHKLHLDWPGRQDCVDTRHIVESLTRRAAHLTAALVTCIPNHHNGATIEGSLSSHVPGFIPALQHKTGQLRKTEMNIIQVPRSSVIGAALLAARLSNSI